MSTVLTPRLRPLDQRALDALDGRALRARRVTQLLHGERGWWCEACGDPALRRDARPALPKAHERRRVTWRCTARPDPIVDECCRGKIHPVLTVTPEQLREVREILRGLEAIGLVTCRGGWWRRA